MNQFLGRIRVKRKYLSLLSTITMIVFCLLLTLPMGILAAGSNTGPQSWSFDSGNVGTLTSRMEKNWGPGDNGQTGSITISGSAGTNYHIWVADQIADGSITYTSGAWIFMISTNQDWGTNGSLCDVEIGYWNGSYHSLTSAPSITHRGRSTILIETLVQSTTLTIPNGTYLAVKLINQTGSNRIVYTAENSQNSYLRSPETDPAYPLPELSTSILMALGLGGLGSFILWQRQKARSNIK
jgi:hypothetical protein